MSEPCHAAHNCDYGECGYCRYKAIIGYDRPCEPGDTCDFNPTVHSEARYKPVEDPKKRGVKAKWDTVKGYEMYKAGASDKEIADLYGVRYQCVAQWRFNRKLPANPKRRKAG